ncbi:MAG: hypothetical protein L6R42_006573 [Xanthoria sp. 1 TBL-2021]|nr:MAG: hypothetical protein L6R42_006573 [Xanthoria sp. 1 TBL-2021]
MASPPKTDIILYTSGTANGQKASITLEELGIYYDVKNIEIIDKTPAPDGQTREKRIFESVALMLYLCQRYDPENKLNFSYVTDEYWEVVEWLVDDLQGQANHFYRYAPEKIGYGIKRYQTEARRLYQVLEDRLAEQAKTPGKEGRGSFNERPAVKRGLDVPEQFTMKEKPKSKAGFAVLSGSTANTCNQQEGEEEYVISIIVSGS